MSVLPPFPNNSAELQLIDKETGAALMLTVVLAIFVVPLVLSLVLRYFAQRRERELNARAKERGPDSVGSSYYRLVIRTPHTFGLLDRVMRVLHLSHVEVLDFRMEYEVRGSCHLSLSLLHRIHSLLAF